MTPKSAWMLLCLFAQLAALPGCLHLPYFRGASVDAAKKQDEPTRRTDDPSAAADQKTKTISKMPVGPLQKEGPHSIEPPGGPKLIGDLPVLDKPNANEGTHGIVIPEPPQGPMELLPTGLSKTPISREKKREDALLRAFKAFLDKRHDEAIQHLRELDNETQELLIRLFPLFVMVSQKPINELSSAEVAVVYDQLLNALLTLRPRCELAVTNLCFCKDVQGYGLYKPLPSNHTFLGGTKDRLGEEVYLYVELKNLLSEKTKDGDYLTRLSCVLELYDASDKKVWSQPVDRSDAPHRRRAPMYDFYRNYVFYVPAIPPGTYRLTMQIADETNPGQRRETRRVLAFRVTPPTN